MLFAFGFPLPSASAGRKLVLVPGGNDAVPDRPRVDIAIVKALARISLAQTAGDWRLWHNRRDRRVRRINSSYVSRVLRLTLLAPDIVEAILDGRQPVEMTLAVLMKPFSVCWAEQTLFVASARSAVIADGRSRPPATPVVD
jgi:hypothetical protein